MMLSRFSRTLSQFPKHGLHYSPIQTVRLMSDVSTGLDVEPGGEAIQAAVAVLPDPNVYNVVGHYQILLDTIQQTSGLPWWSVLIGTGLVLRSSMMICNINFEKKYIRNLPHTAALAKLRSKINILKSKGDMVGALTTVEEVSYYKKKHKFSWKNSANWLLLPNMLTMSLNFFAIRGLTELPYQPFLDSSFLWIPDLCQRDPYFVIPAINAAAICYVMKYGIDSGENKILQDALSNKIVLISLMAGMGAIQSMFPAALVLYWFASNVIGIGVVGPALKNDNFRSRVGLLSMEEKREAVKVLPDLTTLQNDITEGFQEVRKEGHQTDMEERKKRLENLKKEINSEEDLDEMKKSLNEMKNELNQKRIDLEKLTKETDEIEKSLKDRATSA